MSDSEQTDDVEDFGSSDCYVKLPSKLKGMENIVSRFLAEIADSCETLFSSHHKGMAWEAEFVCMCEKRGFSVTKDLPGRHDREVNGHKVQCKQIDQVIRGAVSIDNMRPVKANGGERGYLVSEYDVLALRCSGNVYLVPSEELSDAQRQYFIRSRMVLDDFKHCISAWTIFSGEKPIPQGRLFT